MDLTTILRRDVATLVTAVEALTFAAPVSVVYNPLVYAAAVHDAYLATYAKTGIRALFLGMNPGPFGMAQVGVPFGEIAAVRDWMQLSGPIGQPSQVHLKRPITGFACTKSEVSGRRLWGLFQEHYPHAKDFFSHYFVANYCPLVFMSDTGANITPDKLPAAERAPVEAACDAYLRSLITALKPQHIIGVGAFAMKQAQRAVANTALADIPIGTILHPSPASPAANRGWATQAEAQLHALGVWLA